MTETTTLTTPSTVTPPLDIPHPADILLHLIVACLAPLFLEPAGGDITVARLAALHTIEAYTARNQADLLGIAQIIAYGFAVLGSLSLAMTDGLSISMTLRLRGNANACTRSAEKNRHALTKAGPADPAARQPQAAPEPEPEPVCTEAETALLSSLADTQKRAAEAQARLYPAKPAPVAAPALPTLSVQDQQRQAEWAAAMADVAAEFTAGLVNLPPSERKEASHRATLLNTCANELLSGAIPNDPANGALNEILRRKLSGK